MRLWRILAALALGAVLVLVFLLWPRPVPLPKDLAGSLVYVSDRDGAEALYLRRLPGGEDRRLTFASEPVRDPAIAPDGTRVAFSMGGRIGLVSLPSGEVRIVTLGIDQRDSEPSWRHDGKALVVVSQTRNTDHGELHLLEIDTPDGQVVRTPLTQSHGLSHESPAFSPDDAFVVCIREDHVFRVSLADGRSTRLTGGFRKYRAPRFLAKGRLLALWAQEKQYGIDVMDPDGKNRETLGQGTAFYRTVAPSPDGAYLAATFAYDLAFHLADALTLRKVEEVRLLDAHGRLVAPVVRSGRYANHSPDWGR